tara:strand:+ start:403 stop:687 length:285 start_codon:yes stop_codon:yes gene_type:complete
MILKKYSGLQLYQIDQRNKELEYVEILNNWKNLELESKKKYIKIAKSLKMKPLDNNNSIDELEFLRRYYLSELRKQECFEKRKKLNKLINNMFS